MAKLDKAPDYESGDWGFESLCVYQITEKLVFLDIPIYGPSNWGGFPKPTPLVPIAQLDRVLASEAEGSGSNPDGDI